MSKSPSLAVIKQGTRRRAALPRQQGSWCDDRQARKGCAARSCDGVVTVEKLRGVEVFPVSVASRSSRAGRGARQRSFNSRGFLTSASWLGRQLAVSARSCRLPPTAMRRRPQAFSSCQSECFSFAVIEERGEGSSGAGVGHVAEQTQPDEGLPGRSIPCGAPRGSMGRRHVRAVRSAPVASALLSRRRDLPRPATTRPRGWRTPAHPASERSLPTG